MGSEVSTEKNPAQGRQNRQTALKRGQTIAGPHPTEPLQFAEPSPSGNNSPGASVCSDSELPYISYTVNRPIGDSPKASSSSKVHQPRSTEMKKSSTSLLQRRQLSLQARKPKKAHNIVVVKEAKSTPNIHNDEDIKRLQEIPTFLPIMRGTIGLTSMRDPEVSEGLDFRPLVRLTARYQAHLAACAQPVAQDQAALVARIKETDAEIGRLHALMVDRQKSNARHAERLSRVHETSHQLTRCHYMLNQALDACDALNNMLPAHDRLEPFVWTTG